MISTKKLVKMVRKWQKMAAASRKRISFPINNQNINKAQQGHFVVYTTVERRFAIPLAYLQSEIFGELLRMAEEEFGLASDGPITLPCVSALLEYTISIIQRRVGRELEEALLVSLSHNNSSLSVIHHQQKLVKMVRKWQKMAAASRKRISFPMNNNNIKKAQQVEEKGHFVVYTRDNRRFALPLAYLQSEIFSELLRMAEEEFGLANNGPITLPCDSDLLEYAISIIQRRVGRELIEALLVSLSHCHSSLSSIHHQQVPLVKMVRKWQKMAAASRKRISFPMYNNNLMKEQRVEEKGHFVVYTTDERRFALPLAYLQSEIFSELLIMAEEEFGLASDGPITLPCDSALLEYAISIIQRGVGKELVQALLVSLSQSHCSLSATQHQQAPLSCC
ncbi:hypothetical protein V2J09_005567 [Rumex salicifolius]